MNLLESIKSDKEMTLKHWRYRVLHWAHGINPKTVKESPLSSTLYTHFCPLFHLTNLIVIFAPFIIAYKLCRFLIVGAISTFNTVVDVTQPHVMKLKLFLKKREKVEVEVELTVEMIRAEQKRLILNRLQVGDWDEVDPDKFYHIYRGILPNLTEDEIRKIHQKFFDALKIAKEAAERHRKNKQAWMVFWVNFSRIFLKGFLYTLYTLLFCATLYLTYNFTVPTISFLWWIVSSVVRFLLGFDYLFWGRIMLAILVSMGTIAGLSFGFAKLRQLKKPKKIIENYIVPPISLIIDIIDALFTKIGSFFTGIKEFISVFYEENCPSIKIGEDE